MKVIIKKSLITVLVLITFILVFVAVFYYNSVNQKNQNDLQHVASDYLHAYPLPAGWNKNPNLSDKYAAFQLYNQRDYKEAIVNFKYTLVNNPEDNEVNFYLGICMLLTNEPRNAIREFNLILNESENDSLINEAKWYKALALIKLDRIPQAKRLLGELSSEDSKKLLEEISVRN
jgi:tetratricopeptide (TPR) repeat protein